jgi:DNA-directed RNA polymerase specialized sigma24 family protein
MKCIPELYEQLTHLANNIKQCNYISYNEKQDIVQDALEKIVKKFNEGILVDDFKEIKGYTFMILRNCCNAYHNKNKIEYTDEPLELPDKDFTNEFEERDAKEFLHSIINKFILDKRYTDVDRKICEMMLNNVEDKEIRKQLNLPTRSSNGRTLSSLRKSIKTKLTNDLKRPARYIIKNKIDKDFKLVCYTRDDVSNFFKDYDKYYIYTLIQNGRQTRQGYYVEQLIKKEWKKKKEN